VLALVVGVATWTGNSASTNDEPAVALATGTDAAPEPALAEPVSTTVAAPSPKPTRAPVAVPAANSDADNARVAGRLLLPSGAPAVGAEVSLSGWNANQERVIEFPSPKDWEQPARVFTDSNGRFSIEVDPPRAFQFSIDAQLEGHARLSWRWHEILPGARIDVGERRFETAHTLYVRVLGPDGSRLFGIRFQVSATPTRGEWGTSLDETQAIIVNAQYDERDEVYVLNGLPPGAAKIQARSDATEWLQPRVVIVGPG
jgi:hypothetical protein